MVGVKGRRRGLPCTSTAAQFLRCGPRPLVLATGASELTLPFPGWELPGVVTAGGAQALLKSQHVAIGQRVVVAGTGPFLLPVAAALAHAGARVTAVDAAPMRAGPRALPGLAGPSRQVGRSGRVRMGARLPPGAASSPGGP